jgi:hypothetical protein
VNRDWVLVNLKEAHEELTRTIAELEADPSFEYGDLWPAMQHLYHHLNTAWNARDATPDEVAGQSDKDFVRWTQFPKDLPMMDLGTAT